MAFKALVITQLLQGNSKDQFVATQAPLESTVKDFWRMVIERGSCTIVSLTEVNEVCH